MSIINVKKVNLKKKGYRDLEHWLEKTNHIYVGRTNRYVKGAVGSKWGNPFSVKKFGREGCIAEFKKHLYNSDLINDIEELRGKTLGCWCKPASCHGDVLIEALQQKKSPKQS